MYDQENIKMTEEKVKKMLGKMLNYKAPGPDFVQDFWLKILGVFMKDCADN